MASTNCSRPALKESACAAELHAMTKSMYIRSSRTDDLGDIRTHPTLRRRELDSLGRNRMTRMLEM